MPGNRELKPEVGVGMTPCDQGLKEKTEDRVEEGARSTMSHRGRLTHLPSLIPRRHGVRSFLTAHVETKLVATKVLGARGTSPSFYWIAEVHFPSMDALNACCAFR